MNILFVNPFGVGDVLCSTPLLRTVRNHHPGDFIGYVLNRRALEVMKNNDAVNELFVFEKDEYTRLWEESKFKCIKKYCGFLHTLRSRKFDIVFDMSLSDKFGFIYMLLGINKRVGFKYKKRGRFLNIKADLSEGFSRKHIIEHYNDLIRAVGVNDGIVTETEFLTSPGMQEKVASVLKDAGIAEGDKILGIMPGGGDSWGASADRRRWPAEKFAECGRRLQKEFGVKALLLGSPSEMPLCEIVAGGLENGCINLAGKTSLEEFAECLRRCSLVLSNDGGPFHVAVSQRVSMVSIFGPVNPDVYGPYPLRDNHRIIVNDIECRPCYKNFRMPECDKGFACVQDIEVESVLSVCRELIAGI